MLGGFDGLVVGSGIEQQVGHLGTTTMNKNRVRLNFDALTYW